jgi:hypothetical protein
VTFTFTFTFDNDDDDDDNNNNNNNNNNVWNLKAIVIAVITAATGTTSKSFRLNLNNIIGKHEVKEQQKTATLSTAHLLLKVPL